MGKAVMNPLKLKEKAEAVLRESGDAVEVVMNIIHFFYLHSYRNPVASDEKLWYRRRNMTKGDMIMIRPACDSENTVKNGSIHNGKPKFACKECGRQLVGDPRNKVIPRETKDLIGRLLPEKIPPPE